MSAAALEAISSEPLPPPQTHIEVRIGLEGRLKSTGFVSPPGGYDRSMSTSSPAWGVDRSTNRPTPTQADFEHLCDSFNADLEMLRASARREFVEFNAAGPLFHWSRIEPEEFKRWAKEFLNLIAGANLSVRIEMANFIDAITSALLPLEPETVLLNSNEWSGEPHVRIVSCGGTLPSRIEAVWHLELNNLRMIADERRRLLIEAQNDEEILWHVLAAHVRGNALVIANLAFDWLREDAARERALAVSLLAFHGDAGHLPDLVRLRDTDPSLWVREHARWAWDVFATESGCRQRYCDLLNARALGDVVSGLAELRPALSPMAIAWRASDEYSPLLVQQTPRNRAAIRLFWYHWDSSSSNRKNIALVGRKLREHCRGEPLKDGVSSHMAPWWRLD